MTEENNAQAQPADAPVAGAEQYKVKVPVKRKKRKNHTFLKVLLVIAIIAAVAFLTLWFTVYFTKDFDTIPQLIDYILAQVKK